LLTWESTPSEAAFSGARTVPGEEGWAKGSTVVGRLPGAPMIWVSQHQVCARTTTSTPGTVASVFLTSPRSIRAASGFGKGQGGISPGKSVESYPKIPYLPLLPSHISLSSQCTQVFENKQASLAANESCKEDESDENNNTDPQDSHACSSRCRILSALSGRRATISGKIKKRKKLSFEKKSKRVKKDPKKKSKKKWVKK